MKIFEIFFKFLFMSFFRFPKSHVEIVLGSVCCQTTWPEEKLRTTYFRNSWTSGSHCSKGIRVRFSSRTESFPIETKKVENCPAFKSSIEKIRQIEKLVIVRHYQRKKQDHPQCQASQDSNAYCLRRLSIPNDNNMFGSHFKNIKGDSRSVRQPGKF